MLEHSKSLAAGCALQAAQLLDQKQLVNFFILEMQYSKLLCEITLYMGGFAVLCHSDALLFIC